MIASQLKPKGSKNSEWNSSRLESTHLTTRFKGDEEFVASEVMGSSGKVQGVIRPGLVHCIFIKSCSIVHLKLDKTPL